MYSHFSIIKVASYIATFTNSEWSLGTSARETVAGIDHHTVPLVNSEVRELLGADVGSNTSLRVSSSELCATLIQFLNIQCIIVHRKIIIAAGGNLHNDFIIYHCIPTSVY